MTVGKEECRLIAPPYQLKDELMIPTDRGPLFIEDIYALPFDDVKRWVNAAWGSPREKNRSGPVKVPVTGDLEFDLWARSLDVRFLRDYGRKLSLSMGWYLSLYLSFWVGIILLRPVLDGNFPIIDAFHPAFVLAVAVWVVPLIIYPLLMGVLVDPSYRYSRWFLFTSRYLVFKNEMVTVIPFEAVEDVYRHEKNLVVRNRNGNTFSFPDPELERTVREACGLSRANTFAAA